MNEFVTSVIAGVTGEITLTTVATILASIIGAGIVAIFAWRFAKFGYRYIVGALSGYDALDFAKEGARQDYFRRHGRLPRY